MSTRALWNVLLIDGNPATRTIVRESVESQGWQYHEASDLAEVGQNLINRVYSPNVVLVDSRLLDIESREGLEVPWAGTCLEGFPVIVLTESENFFV